MRQNDCQVMNAHLQTYVGILLTSNDQKTVSQSWYQAQKPLEKWKCIPYDGMEPYTMIRRTNSSPIYDKRFVNYGFNKVQYIHELRNKGFNLDLI